MLPSSSRSSSHISHPQVRRRRSVTPAPADRALGACGRRPRAPVHATRSGRSPSTRRSLGGRDDVVLCHLGHRLVQMSLRLLRAEVWQRADRRGPRTRHSARGRRPAVSDAPVAVVHARLVVTGADGHRLHEEVVRRRRGRSDGRLERLGVNALDSALRSVSAGAATARRARRSACSPSTELWSIRSSQRSRPRRERTASLDDSSTKRRDEEIEKITAVLEELQRAHPRGARRAERQLVLLRPRTSATSSSATATSLAPAPRRSRRDRTREASRFSGASPNPSLHVFPVAVEYRVPRGWMRS